MSTSVRESAEVIHRFDVEDGIATITFDMPGKVNVMTDSFIADMKTVVTRLKREREALVGVVLTSAKQSFFAGGDLALMARARDIDRALLFEHFERLKGTFRDLERLGLPVVAALNGSALGGGYELALACHHRIIIDRPDIVIGLPEINFGILPGAGGVVRLTRLLGLHCALDYLLGGHKVDAQTALAQGLVDDIAVSREDLYAKAKAFIVAHPDPHQPWDEARHLAAVGAQSSPSGEMRKGLGTRAARSIVRLASESLSLDIDAALVRETQSLVELLVSSEAAELIGQFFAARRAPIRT